MKLPFHLVVLDLETNGGRDHEARIVEVGAVCLDEDLKEVGEFEMMVDGRPMLPEATEVNNITDEMLVGKPKWYECYRQFVTWCDQWRPYVLGTWSDFDTSVLRPEYNRIGIRYPHPGHAWDIKTIVWFFCILKGYPSRTFPVDRACEILNLQFEGQKHRALADAKMEAKCFKAAVMPVSVQHGERMW
jgi:DNA polymerase III epsilon subunit-like protein